MLEPVNYTLHILYITVSLFPEQHQVCVSYVIDPNVQALFIFTTVTLQLCGNTAVFGKLGMYIIIQNVVISSVKYI